MKQIVINADEDTHAWVRELAQKEKRTMGNQVLAILGIARVQKPAATRPAKKKGAKKP